MSSSKPPTKQAIGNAVVAIADLVARSGGTQFEIGYLEEDKPIEKARWFAQARFKGALLAADEQTHPMKACEELAAMILRGGLCTFCNRDIEMAQDAKKAECGWYREQDRWLPGCIPGRQQMARRKR